MKTKICSKCVKELPATLEYWHKQSAGKYGLRSKCKKCCCEEMKIYRKTPGFRKREAERAREYRKTEKSIKYRKEYANRAEVKKRIRERANYLYHNDEVVRRKKQERDKKRKRNKNDLSKERWENRLKTCTEYRNNMPDDVREKLRKREKEWREEHREELILKMREERENLDPHYLANILKVKQSDLTEEIISLKREQIKLVRTIKLKQNETK